VSELCCLLNAFILQWAKGKLPIADTGNKKVRTYGMLEIPPVNPLSEHLLLRSPRLARRLISNGVIMFNLLAPELFF